MFRLVFRPGGRPVLFLGLGSVGGLLLVPAAAPVEGWLACVVGENWVTLRMGDAAMPAFRMGVERTPRDFPIHLSRWEA